VKGSYVLMAKMERRRRIKVGKLGEIEFEKGYYAYVGSAMNGIEARIRRHLRKDKKLRWHIDYLLQHATAEKIYYIERDMECYIAEKFIEKFEYVPGFGSSDCKCASHLFYSSNLNEMVLLAKSLGMKEML